MANGDYVCAVCLKDVPVDFRTRLNRRVPLRASRGLAKLKIDAKAVSSVRSQVGLEIKDQIGLVKAKCIAENIESAKIICSPCRLIEVVRVIGIEEVVQRCSP